MERNDDLILFFSKSNYKNIFLSKDEDFFSKYDARTKKYLNKNGKNESILSSSLKKDKTLSQVELKIAMRYAAYINNAYYQGRCVVNWGKLTALPSRKIFEYLEFYFEKYIKNRMLDVIEVCDKSDREL